MRSRVRLFCRMAAFAVDGGSYQRVSRQFTFTHDRLVHTQPLDGALDVQDLHDEAVAGDQARVGCLAAGLSIERGFVQDEGNFVPG